MAILKNALICFIFVIALLVSTAFSQSCLVTTCPGLKQCCNRGGECGTRDEYCTGFYCISGYCRFKGKGFGDEYSVDAGPRGNIESVITPALFDRIVSKVGSNCSAKGFYTYKAFIAAFKSFGAYKGTVAKREIVAILAHFSFGSRSFCYKEEKSTERYCSKSNKYPCEPGKSYYGRGLLPSVTWNEFYGAAGKHLGLPLLKDPDLVARSPEVAFKFAMWFWNRNVRPALQFGFGDITKRVDGGNCLNWHLDGRKSTIEQYLKFCKMLGVTPDQNLHCY